METIQQPGGSQGTKETNVTDTDRFGQVKEVKDKDKNDKIYVKYTKIEKNKILMYSFMIKICVFVCF